MRIANSSWLTRALVLATGCVALCATAQAQSTDLLDVSQSIAGPDRGVPIDHNFTISTAGTYKVTLTDIGATLKPTSAPLAAVKLAITNGATVVGTPLTATPPLTGGAESGQFSATPGTYTVHVIGVPGSGPGSGPVDIQITNTADGSTVDDYSATLALPAGAIPNNDAVINDSFTVSTTGTYQVTLTDFKMPQALSTLTLAITQQGGSLVTTLNAAGSTSATFTAGVTYQIFAIGQAGSPNTGVFSAAVTGAAPVYSKTVAVGSAASVGSVALTAGSSYTLNLTDLIYPSLPLGQLGAVVTLNGASIAQLSAAGNKSFTATTGGTYQVFAFGVPATPPGTGSYTVTVQPPTGAALLSAAQAVATPGGTASAYTFNTNVQSAGSYTANIADFKFAAAFTSLSAVVVQGNSTLGTMANAAGADDTPASITAATGPLSILVFAQAGTSGSLFAVNLVGSSSTPVFQVNQGVGELFGTQQVTVTTAGQYTVSVTDLAFPTAFTSLDAIATQGITRLGTVYTGGSFNFSATPGDYTINVIAQPGGTDNAGTYYMSVGPTPPAPTVTLTSSASSVTSGGTVTLNWSSQGATSCTSTGGSFTGTQALSGSVTTAAITSATTFSLTCVGAGGSTTQSVTVNITASSPGGGKSGGGAINEMTLLALVAALLLKTGGESRRPRRA